MVITTELLELIAMKLKLEPTERSQIFAHLVSVELKRRKRGGRPKADKERLERNREAAKKCRNKKKLKEQKEKHLADKKSERHDRAMQDAGLIPRRKKRRTKNKQRWQEVPHVKPDGLRY